jgi:hypothetical protein
MVAKRLAVAALALAATAALSLATGCLSSTHIIPRGQLVALAQLPPEQRGERVRVVQGFAGADEPPPAPHVEVDAVVVVGRPLPGPPVGVAGSSPPKANVKDSKLWIVVAAITALGLAATEGERFDGWVRLHPMYPVHLYGPGGEYTWMPLAQIDPGTAAWARKAFVREGEGPWQRLGRAPLDRVGFSYALFLGAGQIPSRDGTSAGGFQSHIQLGVFPLQQLGVLFDIGLGWSEDMAGTTVFDSRSSVELQLLPIALGALHAGGFGQLGIGYRAEDGPYSGESAGPAIGGGGLVQIELTTRLALTARAGVTAVYGQQIGELLLGLSIY